MKKGFGSIVAVAMLIVLAVASILGFRIWYDNFSSQKYAELDSREAIGIEILVESVVDDKLYLKAGGEGYLDSLKIRDLNRSVLCNFSNTNLSKGINSFDVSSCNLEAGEIYKAVIVSNDFVGEDSFVYNK